MTGCPPEDDLVRMVEGALADASLAALEAHVDRCEHCASVIAGLGAIGRAAGPRTVGRYQLDRRIAAGGMGEVWAAWDPQLRRELAVKLVRPDRADNGVERERLLREARALARLMHPNVLAVHDVGEVDGEVFLATELVAGDTLANRGGPSADWRQLVGYYVQAARGLAAAHAAGLVHRDVKPSNLLLGADGRVRVADFGLAVRSHTPSPLAPTETPSSDGNDPQITAPGMVAGTPAYMAPEQRAGLPPDARADQYALCLALAESIAGRRPPAVRSGSQLSEWVAERRPREPALDRLCGVLVLGLAADPADRFPDMTSLADALEAAKGAADARGAAFDAGASPANGRGNAVDASPSPANRRGNAVDAGPSPANRRGNAVDAKRASSAAALEPTVPATPAARDRSEGPRDTRARTWTIAGLIAIAAAAGGIAVYLAVRAPGTDAPRTDRGAANPATDRGAANPAADPAAAATADRARTAAPPMANRAGTAAPPMANRAGTAAPAMAPNASVSPGHGGAPIDRAPIDRAPSTAGEPKRVANVSVPTSTATAAAFDFNAIHQAAQVAANHRNLKACQAAVAKIPANVPDASVFAMDLTRATCAMLAGDCPGGQRWAVAAAKAQDIGAAEEWADRWADDFCPIAGDLATRLRRLQAQSGMHGDHVEWCDALLPFARAAKAEVTEINGRSMLAATFENLARGYGIVKQCDQARAMWSEATSLYEGAELVEPHVPNCDVGHAKPLPKPAIVTPAAIQLPPRDPTLQIDTSPAVAAWLKSAERIVGLRDASGCRDALAKQPVTPNDFRVLSVHAVCEMVVGDCAAGLRDMDALLVRQGTPASMVGRASAPFADMYCPIGGDAATRLRRLATQAPSASGSRCSALLPLARDAAAAAASDADRVTAGAVLAELARCLSATQTGCTEARAVIAEAHDLDPRHGRDALAAACR